MSSIPATGGTTPPPSRGFDIGWLLRAVWRHRRQSIVFLIAGALLGIVVAVTSSTTYTGVSTVTVDPVSVSIPITGRLTDQINMQTEASVAASRDVADRAAAALTKQKLDGFTGDGLRDVTDVVVPQGSLVMRISVTESSSKRAVAATNAMAQAYLADRHEAAQVALTATENSVRRQMAGVKGTPDEVLQQRQALTNLLADLSRVSTSPGRIVSPARGPLASSSPAAWKFALGGLVLGAVLAFFAAIVRERVDRRLRHPDAVSDLVAAPVRRLSDDDELFDGFATALLSRDGAVDTANTVALLSTSPPAGRYVAGAFERLAEAQGISLTRRDLTLSATGRVIGYRAIKSAVVLVDASATTDAVQARAASDTVTAVLVVTPVTTRRKLVRLLDALKRESAAIDVVIFADSRMSGETVPADLESATDEPRNGAIPLERDTVAEYLMPSSASDDAGTLEGKASGDTGSGGTADDR